MGWLCLEIALFCLYKAGQSFSRFQQETLCAEEGRVGGHGCVSISFSAASSHTGSVCGQFWGRCWRQDLCFQKAVTVTSHEQEQLFPDAFAVFLAGTAKVFLVCC